MRLSFRSTGLYLLIFIAGSVFFYSCSLIGLNLHSKTPKREKPYPVFSRKDTLRGTLGTYRAWYDVHYYDLNIDVDIEKHYLKGYVDIHFKTLIPQQVLQFDLFDDMKINRIEFKNEELKYIREYNAVYATLPVLLETGTSGVIRIYYEGSPMVAKRPPWKGGFVWKKDHNGKPWIGVACEGDGASLWWPLKDHGSDEPDSCGITVTIPKGLFCVANGTLKSREVKENKETFHWKVSYPINRYNVNFSIGDYVHFTVPYENDGVKHELHFYPLSYNLEKAQNHFKQTVNIIKFFEKAFGEYPWWNDDYKLIETPFMGMEHQTAIAYGNKYKNFFHYDFDYIILHETAHEWWGNSLTAIDMQDVWLQEGFATYSEALYVEAHYNYVEYLKYLALYRMLIKNNHPVVGPAGVDYFSPKNTDVYMKGAWILHTLRRALNNDELFFDIIKTFATRYRAQVVCSQNFIDLVNEKTGEDYNWFFDQYLHTREVPRLELSLHKELNSDEYKLYYRWANTVKGFHMPATVLLSYEGKATSRVRLNPSLEWKAYDFTPKQGQNLPIFSFDSNDGYYTLKNVIYKP